MNKKKSSGYRSRKQRLTAVGTRCADHVTPLYPQKLALTSQTCGGRSVGIVRSRTKATEFSLVYTRVTHDGQYLNGRGERQNVAMTPKWVDVRADCHL